MTIELFWACFCGIYVSKICILGSFLKSWSETKAYMLFATFTGQYGSHEVISFSLLTFLES